jgi:hypothetical protein
MSEKTASDAPVWYSAEAASAWADGFNAATEQRCSADSAQLAAANVRLEAKAKDGKHDWVEIFPYQLEWIGAAGHQVRAIEIDTEPQGSAGSGEEWNPTDEQVRSAATWYRHDLGLLTVAEAAKVKTEARLWLRSWQKEVAALRAEPQSLPTREEIANAIGVALYGEDTFRSPDLNGWNLSAVLPAADATIALAARSQAVSAEVALSAPELDVDVLPDGRCIPTIPEGALWALITTLHSNVEEEHRPMSWSDFSPEQIQRLREAAKAFIGALTRHEPTGE